MANAKELITHALRLNRERAECIDLLNRAYEVADDYSDVRDNKNGGVSANSAMSLQQDIEALLRKWGEWDVQCSVPRSNRKGDQVTDHQYANFLFWLAGGMCGALIIAALVVSL